MKLLKLFIITIFMAPSLNFAWEELKITDDWSIYYHVKGSGVVWDDQDGDPVEKAKIDARKNAKLYCKQRNKTLSALEIKYIHEYDFSEKGLITQLFYRGDGCTVYAAAYCQ